MYARAVKRLGRRGRFLLRFGVIEVLLGIRYVVAPVPRHDNVYVLHDLLPNWIYGGLWILVGAASILAALKGGAALEGKAYGALVIPPFVAWCSYIASWLAWLTTGHGDPLGWATALIFYSLYSAIKDVSGWPEPRDGPRVPVIDRRLRGR